MSSTDQYEIQFIWPSTSPQTVIVTGTFDNWTASLRLNKISTGFEVKTRVPWGEKVKYKFIVDGEWRLRDDRPTEVDYGGYVNNVLTTPPKPAAVEPSVANKSQTRVLNGNGHAADAVSKPELDAPAVNGTAKVVNSDVKAHKVQAANGTGFLSDLASTIVARDGTSSAIGYVASGLGAAMHSVVGVDPINIQKIAISTPKADEMFTLPDGQEPVSNSTDFEPEYPVLETSFHSPTSPVAPIVPIMIVPVNASENNTIPRETFNPEIDSQVQIPVISAKAPPPSDTTPAPIAVSEAEPILGVTDNSVEAETPSKEQQASEAPAVSNGSDVLEAIVPVSTVVDNTSAPSPASVAEVETIEGAVLVKAGQSEELASAIPRVANEASSQEAEQKVDAPISVEATPAVTEASETATPEGAPATKETPAPSTSEPVKVEETKEGSVAAEPVSTTTAVPETKIPPPNVLPITSVQQPSAPEPTTPTKSKFPSVSQQSSPSGSPASSKFGSTKRQKRSSILHKLKEIFHHDKEEKVKK